MKIKLYRAIVITDKETWMKTDGMGIHWTTDWNMAFPYGCKEDVKKYDVFTAMVEESCIEKRVSAESMFGYENEVILIKGSEVEIKNIDKIQDLPPIKVDDMWAFPKNIIRVNVNIKAKI